MPDGITGLPNCSTVQFLLAFQFANEETDTAEVTSFPHLFNCKIDGAFILHNTPFIKMLNSKQQKRVLCLESVRLGSFQLSSISRVSQSKWNAVSSKLKYMP